MEERFNALNVVLCLPEEICIKAITISSQLNKNGSFFALDDKNYFPHITLYMAEFPIKNVPKIGKRLHELAAKVKSFRVISMKYRQSGEGYVDVNYRKSHDIINLQHKIVDLLNPLREGLVRPRDRAKMSQLSQSQQRNIQCYGYRSVGAEFIPHLTLAKLQKHDQSALSGINRCNFSFEANKIALFHLGDYGTCHRLIEIFNLS